MTEVTIVDSVSLQIAEAGDGVIAVEDDVDVGRSVDGKKLAELANAVDDGDRLGLERVLGRLGRLQDPVFVRDGVRFFRVDPLLQVVN